MTEERILSRTPELPVNAEEIYVDYHVKEGGVGITAFTDDAGQPYLGIRVLNWEGNPCGPPVYFRRTRLMAEIVVGVVAKCPVVAFIDAEIDRSGLRVRLSPPPSTHTGMPQRHLSALWGSGPPVHRMMFF